MISVGKRSQQNASGRRNAILSLRNEDNDGDRFSTLTEVTDRASFVNTPTFLGLTPANLNLIVYSPLSEIQSFLVPAAGLNNGLTLGGFRRIRDSQSNATSTSLLYGKTHQASLSRYRLPRGCVDSSSAAGPCATATSCHLPARG